jgi:chromosome segregation ATPase
MQPDGHKKIKLWHIGFLSKKASLEDLLTRKDELEQELPNIQYAIEQLEDEGSESSEKIAELEELRKQLRMGLDELEQIDNELKGSAEQ